MIDECCGNIETQKEGIGSKVLVGAVCVFAVGFIIVKEGIYNPLKNGWYHAMRVPHNHMKGSDETIVREHSKPIYR